MAGEPGNSIEMEMVACDLCGSEESTPVLSGPDRLSGLDGSFTLVRCEGCGLLYQNPRPTAVAIVRFYEGEYLPYAKAIQDERSAARRWRRRFGMRRRCKLILDRKRAGRLLDVGCGTGSFLDAMRDHGWQVQGVELNVEAARYSRERLGLDVRAGSLEATGYSRDTFDAVTLWDVLEHLPSPTAALQLLRRILKPDGLLIIRLPNVDSLDARLFGPYWAAWDLPRHYFAFDRGLVWQLLEQSGFEVLDMSYACAYPPLITSCQWWMDEHWRRGGRLRRLVDWGLGSLAMRLLLVPLFFLLGTVLKRGTVMHIVAQQVEAG
jgi:SAM-dependent methyltransferase